MDQMSQIAVGNSGDMGDSGSHVKLVQKFIHSLIFMMLLNKNSYKRHKFNVWYTLSSTISSGSWFQPQEEDIVLTIYNDCERQQSKNPERISKSPTSESTSYRIT